MNSWLKCHQSSVETGKYNTSKCHVTIVSFLIVNNQNYVWDGFTITFFFNQIAKCASTHRNWHFQKKTSHTHTDFWYYVETSGLTISNSGPYSKNNMITFFFHEKTVKSLLWLWWFIQTISLLPPSSKHCLVSTATCCEDFQQKGFYISSLFWLLSFESMVCLYTQSPWALMVFTYIWDCVCQCERFCVCVFSTPGHQGPCGHSD